jgi:exopolysaccharide biosynthesis protein
MKVTITKSGTYYLTRVWMKNPYQQINKFDSPAYGSTLYRPSALLSKAVSKYNLTGKTLVGFNASGFYLKGTYDAESVRQYPAFDKTSVGTIVITNGKVVRNAYTKAYKTWFIAGVDQSNTLQIFTDKEASTDKQLATKKTWAESVVNSGIRNTFTFAGPLVLNGKATDSNTSFPGHTSKLNRQAICQVDANNFILITGTNLDRQDLINVMLKEKCQTGTNLDGGGSIALIYKQKNSNEIKKIIGDSRSLTEVGYFSD